MSVVVDDDVDIEFSAFVPDMHCGGWKAVLNVYFGLQWDSLLETISYIDLYQLSVSKRRLFQFNLIYWWRE